MAFFKYIFSTEKLTEQLKEFKEFTNHWPHLEVWIQVFQPSKHLKKKKKKKKKKWKIEEMEGQNGLCENNEDAEVISLEKINLRYIIYAPLSISLPFLWNSPLKKFKVAKSPL